MSASSHGLAMQSLEMQSLAMIERFIGFDTTSRNSNLPLIAFVRDTLATAGVESRLTFSPDRQKANLFATLGSGDGGIVLSGHTDTVPVDGQAWTSDPYRLTRRDDRLIGRGVCDMKGFLAIALALAPELAKSAAMPIHLAMSYDEEVGCLGVPLLLDDMAQRGIKPTACLVGEPTGMQVVSAHKGKIGCHVTVTGLEAHTGVAHLGVNAIEAAADAIAYLNGIARRHREQGPFAPDFDAPHYTTIQCGLISGGVAVNVVPRHCAFDFDIRYLPGVDPMDIVRELQAYVAANIEPQMRRVAPDAGFAWEFVPGCEALDSAEDEPIVQRARELTGANRTFRVGFGTEAGYFQKAGIPTVVCGPGDIAQAHKPDEFITLDQVARCENFLRGVVRNGLPA